MFDPKLLTGLDYSDMTNVEVDHMSQTVQLGSNLIVRPLNRNDYSKGEIAIDIQETLQYFQLSKPWLLLCVTAKVMPKCAAI